MEILKGVHLLKWLKEETIKKMEEVAFSKWQNSRLTFRFLKVTDKEVTIGATQANLLNGQYLNQKELIQVVHESFDKFFPKQRVLVHASPYKESPAQKVDSAWIKKKMEQLGIALKDICDDTGMNNTQLSAVINGVRPLSDAMKAMFFFYFKTKEK
ncbi:hypothetical protein FAM09_24790 [Niastella caeni]|uniref:Uncharacterized protein n=1 Tax=Niastella caeni TaxID=2569763 RepID=A0A4S8HIZ6_9BACT|nr:hypothetical protein [Niastella caeni]THU34239.1 hypothetical protein FAM09_24790 [Niastella caeni]